MTALMTDKDVRRGVHALMAAGTVALALGSWRLWLPSTSIATAIGYCATAAAWIATWWWLGRRMRQPHRLSGALVALALVTVASLVTVNMPATFILLTATLVLLVLVRATLLWVSLSVGTFLLLLAVHVQLKPPLSTVLNETAGIAEIVGLSVAVGWLLRALIQQRSMLRTNIATMRATNDQLVDAHRLVVDQAARARDEILQAERGRSARDLHDGLGNMLTSVTMSLDFADRMFDKDVDAARAELRHARDTTRESLEHMRAWVRAIHPRQVDPEDGPAGWRAVAESFSTTALDVDVTWEGRPWVLSAGQSDAVWWLVQEGLTNAMRHGGAESASLSFVYGERVVVSLTNDGDGQGSVSQRSTDDDAGFGLRSLRTRAAACGGSFEAGPTDSGWRVAMSFPKPATARWVAGDSPDQEACS